MNEIIIETKLEQSCCINCWKALQEVEQSQCEDKRHDWIHNPKPKLLFELERLGTTCPTSKRKLWICYKDTQEYYRVINLCPECKSIMELEPNKKEYFCSDCYNVNILES